MGRIEVVVVVVPAKVLDRDPSVELVSDVVITVVVLVMSKAGLPTSSTVLSVIRTVVTVRVVVNILGYGEEEFTSAGIMVVTIVFVTVVASVRLLVDICANWFLTPTPFHLPVVAISGDCNGHACVSDSVQSLASCGSTTPSFAISGEGSGITMNSTANTLLK